ncbi:radical SAM protein [bacterium]|nr:radical SAM protein [candidate division CSSED10-310 bacterium]
MSGDCNLNRASLRHSYGLLNKTHGNKFSNFQSANRELSAGKTIVSSMPSYVRLEVTSCCNLKCIFCELKYYQEAGKHFSRRLLKRVMRMVLPHTAALQIGDLGEPLLYPELNRLLDSFNKKPIPYVKIITNGILLSEKIRQKLLNGHVTSLVFSIDGTDKETFETLRRGGNFNQLLSNIETLCREKKKLHADLPKLAFNMVLLKDNYHQITELVDLATRNGISMIYIQKLHPSDIQINQHSVEKNGLEVQEMIQKARLAAFYHNIDMQVDFSFHEPIIDSPEVVDDRFYSGSIEVINSSRKFYQNSISRIWLRVKNKSPFTWYSSQSPSNMSMINLSYHIADATGDILEYEGLRTFLPRNLEPGEEVECPINVKLPEKSGKVTLVIDLVNECRRWFGIDYQFEIDMPETFALDAAPEDPSVCVFPWRYISIKVNGDIFPCRFLSVSMGNILKQTLKEIWNSKAYQLLRKTVHDKSYSFCIGACCPYLKVANASLRSSIRLLNPQYHFRINEQSPFNLEITNTGNVMWNRLPNNSNPTFYTVSYHIIDSDGHIVVFDGYRSTFSKDVYPGECFLMSMKFQAPDRSGIYQVVIDIIREKITWFEVIGNPVTKHSIEVT